MYQPLEGGCIRISPSNELDGGLVHSNVEVNVQYLCAVLEVWEVEIVGVVSYDNVNVIVLDDFNEFLNHRLFRIYLVYEIIPLGGVGFCGYHLVHAEVACNTNHDDFILLGIGHPMRVSHFQVEAQYAELLRVLGNPFKFLG